MKNQSVDPNKMVIEDLNAHSIDAAYDERDKLRVQVRMLRERVRKLVKENRNLMSGMLALFLAGDAMAERMVECPEVNDWKKARKAKP